jgi:hypothetical protein
MVLLRGVLAVLFGFVLLLESIGNVESTDVTVLVFQKPSYVKVSRDNSIGIANRYGLGLGGGGEGDIPHPSRPALWPTQPLVIWVSDSFPVGKAAGAWP